MSDLVHTGANESPSPVDLRAQADTQVIELLKLASTSADPAFVAATLEIAKDRQKQQHKSEAKLSPGTAVTLATSVGLLIGAACWYALVNHPGKLGMELTGVMLTIGLLMVCLYALLSGYLSQANFMVVFRWVSYRLKGLNPFDENGGKT